MASDILSSDRKSLDGSIGNFLLRRLREFGLSHEFGVAGDFNLELLEQIEALDGPTWIGCCNELNASYAADGCARTRGLSALITTYGISELSVLCGIAGAFSEHVPVIAITGAPPMSEIERKGLLQAWFWQRMASFVKPGDVIIAVNGTSLSGVSGMPLPHVTGVLRPEDDGCFHRRCHPTSRRNAESRCSQSFKASRSTERTVQLIEFSSPYSYI
jgi:TPP-dependent 2-oxoacid decarboxylase